MALAISNIPVLRGKVADTFVRKAMDAEKEKVRLTFHVSVMK